VGPKNPLERKVEQRLTGAALSGQTVCPPSLPAASLADSAPPDRVTVSAQCTLGADPGAAYIAEPIADLGQPYSAPMAVRPYRTINGSGIVLIPVGDRRRHLTAETALWSTITQIYEGTPN
jgi:hypothetical protein